MIVGMEDRVDEFMRAFSYDNGQWYFSRESPSRVAVTEDEVGEAEDRYRFRFRIATVISWTAILAATAWCFVRVIGGNLAMWKSLYAVAPAFYVSFLAYGWAMQSSAGPLRRRLWDQELKDAAAGKTRRKRRRGRPLEPHFVIVRQTWLLWAMFLGWSALSAWEYRNNVRALNGVTVTATVTRSDARFHHKCQVDYAFDWHGRTYGGTETLCKVMYAHPVGSRIEVKIDPGRPQHPVLPGSSPWPAESIIPILMAPFLLLILVLA